MSFRNGAGAHVYVNKAGEARPAQTFIVFMLPSNLRARAEAISLFRELT